MKHQPVPHKRKPQQRGFTLLLAALIASIVLALGASIYEIAQKEVQLSSIGRDSQFAFYTADTIAECALYWDFRFSYFATSSPANVVAPDPRCDTQSLLPFNPDRPVSQPYYPYTMTSQKINLFQDSAPEGGYCGQVSVTKSLDPVTNAIRTVIHADGYSVACAALSTSATVLQRSVELHY